MALRRMLTQTVGVRRFNPSGLDEYGNPVESWDPPVSHPARLEQTGGEEMTTQRNVQIGDWRLFLLPDVAIGGRDRVEADGETFEVVGPPVVQRAPRGAHHIEANLQHVEF